MTSFRERMRTAARELQAAGVDDAAHDARALLLHVTGMSLTDLLLRQDEEMPPGTYKDYVNLIRRRAERIPLQHLTGTQWFYGLEFQVNEHVLIPRPETELLVETVLSEWSGSAGAVRIPDKCTDRAGAARIPDECADIDGAARIPDKCAGRAGAARIPDKCTDSDRPMRILDLCTGSGCILIALLHELADYTVHGTGADISPEALATAEVNARRNGLSCRIFRTARRESDDMAVAADTADMADTADTADSADAADPADMAEAAETADTADAAECFPDFPEVTAAGSDPNADVQITWVKSDLFSNIRGVYDVIVSNPPYIPRGQIGMLAPEVRDHDPHMALDGGEDGLDFYRILAAESPKYLKPGGRLVLEIGSDQAGAVRELLEKAEFFGIAVHQDLSGLDRVISANRMAAAEDAVRRN